MDAKCGNVPEDVRYFSLETIETMRTAFRHICYLPDEGYDLKQAPVFVCNHFLLSERLDTVLKGSLPKYFNDITFNHSGISEAI